MHAYAWPYQPLQLGSSQKETNASRAAASDRNTMGLIKVKLRRSKDESQSKTQHSQEPEPIKRYRVQSMPAQAAQLQYSRSVRSHRDDFRLVTEAWKRQEPGPIQILEPSDASLRSESPTWSNNTFETGLEVKLGPQQEVAVGSVSPTFSLCGSEMSSPSLSYSNSISSNSSGWSYKSEASIKKSYTPISAGIPPVLPPHRTFSGNPHYGSFCKPKNSSENLRGGHNRTASDYIPVHVFTRQCSQRLPTGSPVKLSKRERQIQANQFNLDGYAGKLRVVNTTPPSSPQLHRFDVREQLEEQDQVEMLERLELQERIERPPERYRVPSKAALMDY